jgi:hypothetical protein
VNAPNKLMTPALQNSCCVGEIDIQHAEGVSVLDRVVPARRYHIHVAWQLRLDGLEHELTMEDMRRVGAQVQRSMI